PGAPSKQDPGELLRVLDTPGGRSTEVHRCSGRLLPCTLEAHRGNRGLGAAPADAHCHTGEVGAFPVAGKSLVDGHGRAAEGEAAAVAGSTAAAWSPKRHGGVSGFLAWAASVRCDSGARGCWFRSRRAR